MWEIALKEDIEQLFKASCDDLKWLEENYDRLKREYDGKWVIIQDKKVVASGGSYESIMNALKKCDPRKAIVEYVQSEQVAMFF
jgi:hypothetical protein